MASLSRIPLVFLLVASAFAEVRLASPFTDNMVLQRQLPVPVWGTAEPGEKVAVEFGNQLRRTKAGKDGRWLVLLETMAASSQGRRFVVHGSQTAKPLVLENVLVGEVWIASGQSNMEFRMSQKAASWAGVENEEAELAQAHHPELRFFTAAPIRSYTPQQQVAGQWESCTPETAARSSAIAYYFGRELQRELKVPVGMLVLAYGGSCSQAWIRRGAIEEDPVLREQLRVFDEKVKAYEPLKGEARRPPTHPRPDPVQDQHNPTVLFNGMVAPVMPFSARGFLWYQGESITEPKDLFPRWNQLLIQDWRRLWGRNPDTMPFYFCQLAAHDRPSNSPQVREWQTEALRLPNTAMAVTIDIGDRKDVHPHNKLDVGLRLARIALARDYGRRVEWSGPRLEGTELVEHGMRLRFSRAEGGLVAKGGPLKTFEICGEDGEWFPGDAIIQGETIFVSSVYVSRPKAVRYAWSNYPDGCNLMNAAGLPAAPFRTDGP